MKLVFPMFLFVSFSLLSAAARADIAPPDKDTKSVEYTFTVHGIAGVPADVAVFSFPCSGPHGETLLQEGSVVRAAGGPGPQKCVIYRTVKSNYDAWQASLASRTPTELPTRAVQCKGGPSPLTQLDADDPRTSINEDLDVQVDATSCSVTSRGVPQRSNGGCSATGGSNRAPLALILGLPAVLILIKKRRPVVR